MNRKAQKHLLAVYAYSHTALTVFDAIATLCDNSLRGPLKGSTERDIEAIRRIALRQRKAQCDVLDSAEAHLLNAMPLNALPTEGKP